MWAICFLCCEPRLSKLICFATDFIRSFSIPRNRFLGLQLERAISKEGLSIAAHSFFLPHPVRFGRRFFRRCLGSVKPAPDSCARVEFFLSAERAGLLYYLCLFLEKLVDD
jgi:hypothetical protein